MSNMIHNKYFQILSTFTENYNKEIHGRELAKHTSFSQKSTANSLNELENKYILHSRKKGNIKLYSLNLDNPIIQDIINLTEYSKKLLFFEKNPKIPFIFSKDTRIIGIFGSFAKKTHIKSSDLDIFIIGNKGEDYETKSNTLGIKADQKRFTEKEFRKLLREKDNLAREISKDHIIIFGAERFTKILWEEHYRLDKVVLKEKTRINKTK